MVYRYMLQNYNIHNLISYPFYFLNMIDFLILQIVLSIITILLIQLYNHFHMTYMVLYVYYARGNVLLI